MRGMRLSFLPALFFTSILITHEDSAVEATLTTSSPGTCLSDRQVAGQCLQGSGMVQVNQKIALAKKKIEEDALGATAGVETEPLRPGHVAALAKVDELELKKVFPTEAERKAYLKEMEPYGPDCKKLIKFTWAAEEAGKDGAAFKLGLEDVAIGLISGREEFFNASHGTVLRYAARGIMIRARGKCPCSFRPAFSVLRDVHPHAKWYYIGDEDAMIDLGNLVKVLSQYDSSVPTLVAANGSHDICKSCGYCPHITDQEGLKSPNAFFGGTGQIVSAGLMEAISHTLSLDCTKDRIKGLQGFGDLENTCNFARIWKSSWKFVRLKVAIKTWPEFNATGPRFVVAHHLCPKFLTSMSHINKGRGIVHREPIFVENGQNNGCNTGHGEDSDAAH